MIGSSSGARLAARRHWLFEETLPRGRRSASMSATAAFTRRSASTPRR
ncbi:hypothetical protein ACVOMV_29385 [Mesorhizobium atlanticum]